MKLVKTPQVPRAAKQGQHHPKLPQEVEGDAGAHPAGIRRTHRRLQEQPSPGPSRTTVPVQSSPVPSRPAHFSPVRLHLSPVTASPPHARGQRPPLAVRLIGESRGKNSQSAGSLFPPRCPRGTTGAVVLSPRPMLLPAVLPRNRPDPAPLPRPRSCL